MRNLLLALVAILLLPSPARADDFWVDGKTGADLPQNGRTPQMPWKTIAYALAQIPTPVAPATHTLHVAGGQTYAPTTNGEVFPLAMRPGVALVGSPPAPVLDPGSSQRTLAFASATSFGPDTRLAGLELRGQQIWVGGVRSEHSPTFTACRFTGGGLLLGPGDDAVIAARIEDCSFEVIAGAQAALHVLIAGQATNAVVTPVISGCVFTGASVGVWLDHGHDDPLDTTLIATIDRCRFDRCRHGVLYLLDGGRGTTRSEVTVRDCSFHDNELYGIRTLHGFTSLTVEGCRFFAGNGTAIAVENGAGRPALLRHNVVVGCGTGMDVSGQSYTGYGTLARVRVEDCLVLGCQLGISIGQSTYPLQSPPTIALVRCRLLDNDRGVALRKDPGWPASPALIAIESSLVAGGSTGLVLDTRHVVAGNGLTIADHAGIGVEVTSVGAGSELTHCIVAGNGTDLAGTMPTSWCAFQSQDVPGTGNLRADPLLLRPTYKLQPASPCIDAGSMLQALPATDYEGDPRVVAGGGGTRPDLGADEFVPAGSLHVHGVPGVGQEALPPRVATPNRSARLGEPLDVQLRDARDATGAAAVAAVLVLGVDEVALDLTPAGAPGSLLATTPLVLTAAVVPDAAGTAAMRFAIPAQARLYGEVTQLQWLVLFGSRSPVALSTSDALRVTIGR